MEGLWWLWGASGAPAFLFAPCLVLCQLWKSRTPMPLAHLWHQGKRELKKWKNEAEGSISNQHAVKTPQMLQGLLLHRQQRTASTCPSPLRQHKWKPNSQALKVICLSSPPLLPLPATFCLPLASYYFLVNKVVSVSLKSIELVVRPGRIIHRDLLALQFCIIYYKCLWAEGSCLDFTQGMIVCLLVRLFLCLCFPFPPPFFLSHCFFLFPSFYVFEVS